MVILIKTEQDVYEALKKRNGREPDHQIWNYLKENFYVHEAIEAPDSETGMRAVFKGYDDLAKLRSLQRKSRQQDRNVHRELPDERLKYLSKILAWDAAQELAVIDFRRELLGGQLLSPDKIKDWIVSMASKEGMTIEVVMELLYYGVPDDKWQYSIPVAKGGVLERLRELSKYLGSKYNWQEAQATTFVISGLIPLLPLAQSTLNLNRRSLYPAHDTVTIKLSPHLSPKEVANIYSKARRKLMTNGQKRNRPITKKHLELAVFYHTHQGMKWAEIKNLWNKEYTKYRYTGLGVTNFARDAKYARDRLLG
jgi:hypothetical protein